MLSARQCFFCNKTKSKLYSIIDRNGVWHQEIKSALMEYLDENVEAYFDPNDSICQGCWSVIASMVKLRNRLWRHISFVSNNRNREVVPVDLEKLGSILTAIPYDEDLEVGDIMGKVVKTPDLITPTHSVDYDVAYELEFQRLQSANSLNGKDYLAAASGKLRPRTRCYSSDPHIGRRGKKRPRSTLSARSLSRLSLTSCCYSPIKTYDLERHYDEKPENFYCSETDCFHFKEKIPFVSLKAYTFHLTKHHNAKAPYTCTDCQEKFLSKKHLRFHKEENITTHMGPIICSFCGRTCNNCVIYQQHIEKHMRFSIWCKFCDNSYLDELDYYEHMKEVHKDQKAKARWDKMKPKHVKTIQKMVVYKEEAVDEIEEPVENDCEFIEMEQGEIDCIASESACL